jgi:dienelactone hydrolase
MMSALLLCLTLFATSELHTDPFALLSGQIVEMPAAEMMKWYFLDHVKNACDERSKVYDSLKTPEDITAYQQKTQTFFVTQLGGFPERAPLNARTVEQGERDLFRYEKVIFESRPNHFVTALLYLPKTAAPWPGVIVPCGHDENGKANESYQKICMLLAANGMAALCYDPIGQGERYTYLKEDNTKEFASTLEHILVGIGAILTGANTATYRVWDGMRAIDYLQSRDDIIADRIGCTGNSGGGTLTSYLMALDERIVCAAPSCYLTSFDRLLNTIGAQDAEQNIFGQVAFGMDHPDYVHMRAPKPTLMCTATKDFFDITGSWNTFREAKRLFTRLGYAERVDIIEYDAEHGFSQPLREATARWMSRWLLDKDCVIVEPEFNIFSDEEAQCTPAGQVMLMENAVSVLDLNAQRAAELKVKRQSFRTENDDNIFREKVRALIGYTEDGGVPEIAKLATFGTNEITYETFLIKSEQGIVLPAVLALPKKFTGDIVLVLHEAGKSAVLAHDGIAPALLAAGDAVLAVDLRGMGETRGFQNPQGWHDYIGSNWQDYFTAYLLGKSFVGMHVCDIQAAVTCIQQKHSDKKIRLVAVGTTTVPALHAAALYPETFKHIELRDGIPSWEEVANSPRAKDQLINAVHDALSWYDLPDLVALIPEDSVGILNAFVPVF